MLSEGSRFTKLNVPSSALLRDRPKETVAQERAGALILPLGSGLFALEIASFQPGESYDSRLSYPGC